MEKNVTQLLLIIILLFLKACNAGNETYTPPPAPGEWKLVFHDEFEGDEIDRNKWSETSSSLRDDGQGNSGQNNQYEWNTFDNLEVRDGILKMHAHRETYISPSGWEYPWTGSMINSSPGFTFTYGYIEERSKLPLELGFWPAFWTWQAPGGDRQQEVDVFEFWSSWEQERYLATSHPWGGGQWIYYTNHETSADKWNVYGADIRPDGVTYYLNGVKVHQNNETNVEDPMNIISNLAVDSQSHAKPPEGVDHAVKKVDYIRAWKRK